MNVSFIIPIHQEDAAEVERLRDELARLEPVPEVIVVPSGGQGNRARQMNEGAKISKGSLLCFLHVDSQLSQTSYEALLREITGSRAVGGAFGFSFGLSSHTVSQTILLKWIQCGAKLRNYLWHSAYGDQGIFVRREVFNRLGGFELWPILEDLDFFRRLKREGQIILLKEVLMTSPRRYLEKGVLRTMLRHWLILICYHCGMKPERIARLPR